MEKIKLTQYSKGAGCGCKIAPQVLETILKSSPVSLYHKKLIVGNESKDDAAVYEIDKNKYLISSNDFFTPIVDDPFDFGRIASANSLSDIYAMGGQPILAIGILGWPVEKLSASIAREVLGGAREICNEAGIPLAGGHSIDSPEPFFGLSVNGLVEPSNLKKNNTAKENDLLYITKKIGVGIFSTAEKRGKLKREDINVATKQMIRLNSIGKKFGELQYISSMTDITGFGLLGHLIEMAEGANLQAEINYNVIPLLSGIEYYISQMCIPDNTYRNWNSYEKKVDGITGDSLITLCDPQTNGGLLVAVDPMFKNDFENILTHNHLHEFIQPIGRMTKKNSEISVRII